MESRVLTSSPLGSVKCHLNVKVYHLFIFDFQTPVTHKRYLNLKYKVQICNSTHLPGALSLIEDNPRVPVLWDKRKTGPYVPARPRKYGGSLFYRSGYFPSLK